MLPSPLVHSCSLYGDVNSLGFAFGRPSTMQCVLSQIYRFPPTNKRKLLETGAETRSSRLKKVWRAELIDSFCDRVTPQGKRSLRLMYGVHCKLWWFFDWLFRLHSLCVSILLLLLFNGSRDVINMFQLFPYGTKGVCNTNHGVTQT